MKIFQTIRKQYAIVGISSSNQSTQKYLFNERILIIFILFGCTIVSQFVYIYVANSFMDCVDCVFSLSAGIIVCVCFLAIVFRRATLFECIDSIEKLIDSSKPFWGCN